MPERRPVVTFLFTDIEESTRLWADFPHAMLGALERHDAILEEAVQTRGGRVVRRTGDGVNAVFAEPGAAVKAAICAQVALSNVDWATVPPVRARMALHTGPVLERGDDYFGMTPNMTARLRDAGHGGQILMSAATLRAAGVQTADDASLVPLGVHRLRGIPGHHRIYQLLYPGSPDRFAPLRTLDAAVALTVPATSFHGRAHELAILVDLVATAQAVTLVGPGGVGKTRLAVELAGQIGHRFRDGLRMIDLAPILGDAVPSAVAAGLGLVRRGRRSFLDTILEWLGAKHLLLIVDNCEHVLHAVGPLVRDVAETSTDVTVLCTSRQPLGFVGELCFPVEPLELPSSEDTARFGDFPAVRLFADRVAAARHGLQVEPEQLQVAGTICRQLDGIPLALELAAARARSMGLQDLAAHLHVTSPLLTSSTPDHPRHRDLLSTIQWSYDLLSPETQEVFDRLSVFSGSWTVAAAHAVCAEGLAERDVLSHLSDLVDRSMVVADLGAGETRYRMLSTLRDFAADRLEAAAGTSERRGRHAAFYLGVAEAAERGLRTAAEAAWVAKVAADFGNMHAAHIWSIDHGDVDLDARLLVALWNYGLQRLSAEYFGWVDQAVDALSFDDHPRLADLHGIVALGAWLRGDLSQTMRSCRAALDAEERLGAGVSLPARMATILAATYAAPVGDPAVVEMTKELPSRFLEVVGWCRELGDPFWLVYSMVTGSLGMVMTGESERAVTLSGRAIEAARRSGCPTSVAWALFSMATALEQTSPDVAELHLDESVRIARGVDSGLVLGLCMSLLATLRRRLGRPLDAIPLLLELLDHWDRRGDRPQLWHTVRESGMCLGLLGVDQAAVGLLASVQRAELVMPFLPADRVYADQLTAELRERMGDATFAAASAAGADSSREAAVALALSALTDALS